MLLRPRDMRDHFWTRRHMSDYLDDDLRERQRQRVERHVHSCPSCHRLLATLRKTLEGLHALRERPLRADGLTDSVIGRLRDSS